MPACRVCLGHTDDRVGYHRECIESLFGTTQLPTLDFELSSLYSLAAKMAGKMSISGMQEKISLKLTADRSALEVAASGGRYILMPETSRFSGVPQIEHLTMRLAALASIVTPPFGLVRLKDASLAYIIKRFDRLDDGSKLQVEDFCQLSEKPLRDKYQGSGELCVRILRKFASEPLVEIFKLFRLLLFSWWVSNGDMHLKNFSLLTTPDGIHRLSPAYDLVCTRLIIPDDDQLALPIGGRDKSFSRQKWLDFAEYCKIPERAARRIISEQINACEDAIALISSSYLSTEMKDRYERTVRENTAVLSIS